MKEIENQVKQTEERGRRVVEYLDMYKGQNIYNEIALAIEFGYQLRLEEGDYTKEDMLEAFNAGNKRGHSGYPNTDNWTQPTFEDFISRKKE